jgi:hypothetical protein
VLTLDQAGRLLYQLSLTLNSTVLSNRRDALAWLGRLPSADYLHLDNAARDKGSHGAAFAGRPDPAEETGLGAFLASMHSDGYLREKALPHLRGDAGASLLAIRTADHVPWVRSAARALLLNGQYSETRVLGVLLTVRDRLHAGDLVDHFTGKLTPEQFAILRHSDERALRRWAYQQSRLTIAELEAGALDNDQWLRAWCADSLAQQANADLAPHLLTSRFAETRMAALLRLPDELLPDGQLYREIGQRTDARVYGLTATGGPEDLPFVTAQLADHRPAVRVAAAKAVAAWTNGEERARLLGPLLLDTSSKVVGTVVPGLAELPRTTTAGALAAALSSDQPWSRRGVMRVELSRQSWYALEVILQLVVDPDPELAALANVTLTNWLGSNAAAGQHLPAQDQRDRLRRLVVSAELNSTLTREIVFYARL